MCLLQELIDLPMNKFKEQLHELLSPSQRLNYSLITVTDLEEVRELHNHPKVLAQLTDPKIVSEHEQRKWFTQLNQSLTSVRIVCRTIQERELIGVARLDRIDVSNMSLMIGLDVHPEFHRLGFGLEAYKSLFHILFQNLNFNRIHLETLESNLAAIALYKKLGMQQEGIARKAVLRDEKFVDCFFFSILQEEWLAQSSS
jgi:RimJ/RimL family protein N-acetyltransferase